VIVQYVTSFILLLNVWDNVNILGKYCRVIFLIRFSKGANNKDLFSQPSLLIFFLILTICFMCVFVCVHT